MRVAMVLVAAETRKHLDSLPTAANVTLLVVIGALAAGLGSIGWRNAQRIVPTSLPETLYRQRCRVVRRGAASFFVLGLVMIAVGIFVAFVS